jgi:hypothetical protein
MHALLQHGPTCKVLILLSFLGVSPQLNFTKGAVRHLTYALCKPAFLGLLPPCLGSDLLALFCVEKAVCAAALNLC